MLQTVLGCTLLEGTNKVGTLVPDADGYYTVCLGALEFPNHSGIVYSKMSFDKMTAPNSPFMRRLKAGLCYGEFGHPKQEVGMSFDQWIRRLTVIEETRVCMHIQNVWLDTQAVKHQGRYITAIMGKIRPEGPYGEYLLRMLQNGKANVAFSVRSLCKDNIMGGRLTRHFETLMGWDFVIEPGLSVATKYNSPGLESFDDFESLIAKPNEIVVDLNSLKAVVANQSSFVGLENSTSLLQEMIVALEQYTDYASIKTSTVPSMHW
jgi:hypothetical protein